MTYTPETISDASEKREVFRTPRHGIVVVDALSYKPEVLAELVGQMKLMLGVGFLVVGDRSFEFTHSSNVQFIDTRTISLPEILRHTQPDIVISSNSSFDTTPSVATEALRVLAKQRKPYRKERENFSIEMDKHASYTSIVGARRFEGGVVEQMSEGYPARVMRDNGKGTDRVEINVLRSHWQLDHPKKKYPNWKSGWAEKLLITKPELLCERLGSELVLSTKWYGSRQFRSPIDARWNGTIHTNEPHEQLLGVRGVVERAMRENDKSMSDGGEDYHPTKSNKISGYLAEYDVAIGSAGFYAGLIGAIGGQVATEHRFAVKALTEAAAGLVFAATAVEATVKSERVRGLVGKAKKFLSSAMVFGLGASMGMMVGGVLEMGSELVEAVGAEMVHENEWNVVELESQSAQEETIVSLPPTEAEIIGESDVKQVSEPEMTWAGLTAHFEQVLTEDGGEVWVNDQGTVRTDDDVSQAQVMAHKTLMAGGIDEAASALEAIAKTTSFGEYMQERAAGSIYSGVGN